MRKLSTLLFLVLLSCSSVLTAQTVEVVSGRTVQCDVPIVGRMGAAPVHQKIAMAACGPDTLAYPLNKSTSLRILNLNGSTSASTLGQYYDAPQPITISKLRFYAYKLSTQGGLATNVVVEIYRARADSLPLGAPLQFTTVVVDTNYYGGTLSDLEKVATFNTPITMTGPYIVAVRNNSPNPVGIVINDYTTQDGANEWLGEAQISGTWRHGYQVNVSGVPFNCDILLDPVVNYDLRANFSATPSCIVSAGYSTFTNTSSPVLRNRMYSLAEFLHVGGYQVRWNFGDFTGSQTQVTGYDTTHFYSAPGAYVVHLSDSLIGWTMTCHADTSISLSQPPTAAFSLSTSNLTATFTNQSINGPTSYLWTFGDGQTSTAASPSHTYALGGTYTVCMTATSACGSDSACHTVSVSCPLPATAFSGTPNNLSVQFSDLTTGNGVNTWMWSFGDGGTSLTQNPSHVYATAGTYLVCLTASNACGSDSACSNVTVTCVSPVADFAQTGTSLNVSFTNQSTGQSLSHLWDFGDGATSTLMNPSHTFSSAGTYHVCLTCTNTCGTDSLCKDIQIPLVGVSTAISDAALQLSPNPTSSTVRIELSLHHESFVHLGLFNAIGQQVLTRDLGILMQGDLTLDVSGFAAGTYLLRVMTDDGTLSRRLEILR